MKLCLFSLDETSALYGVDASRVVEFVRGLPVTIVPLSSPQLLGLLNVHGQVVPALLPPLEEPSAAGASRRLQRQGSFLVLEGGEPSGRFAVPAGSVTLAEGQVPELGQAGNTWCIPAETSTGRAYHLLDLPTLARTLQGMLDHYTPAGPETSGPALAG